MTATPLTRTDLEYLEGLVRREIARKRADLRGFRKRDGQTLEDADRVRAKLLESIAYRVKVLERLGATWGRPA